MTRIPVVVALFVILAAASARSQEGEDVATEPKPESSPGIAPETSEAPTPAARYYSRDRSRVDKPKSSSRFSRAEYEANQRVKRLEAMRWYGLSNARPVVSPTPWFGTYSPTWTSGGVDPFRWQDPNLTPYNYYNGNYYGHPLPPRYYYLGY
jgi:hypothetical protein